MLGNERYVRLVSTSSGIQAQYPIQAAKDIIGVLDNSNNFVDTYNYAAYGQIEDPASSTELISMTIIDNPFQYTKEYCDMESGLIYLRARYYNPKIKRFISRDTTQLINRYSYANGNPIMNIDPSGHIGTGWLIASFIVGIIATVATAGVAGPILGSGLGATLATGAIAGAVGTAASDATLALGGAVQEQSILIRTLLIVKL